MKIPLHQGFYEARSPIANAQVSTNLYPEANPQDAPFPVTVYPAPGTTLVTDFTGFEGVVSSTDHVRGLYMTSAGNVIVVIGTAVIAFGFPSSILLGQLAGNSGSPVSICDNGATIVLVDGSPFGYMCPIDPAPGSLVQIDDPAFYGSNRVDYIDTFLVFNQPGTGNFYTTTSGVVTPFDATYAAAKEGWNDRLVCCACLHDNIWLFGSQTAEIWYNAGGTTFPFARMPNSILQQGCVAAYSVVIADNAVYWLSQDRWGRNMIMRGEGYMAKRVSTFAIENQFLNYGTIADCIGMAFQLGGHEMIGFYFPSANAWWAYDASTQMWHQRTYNGLGLPWLPYCMMGWGSVPYVGNPNAIFAGSRIGPQLLQVASNIYTDYPNVPITRQRSWAHNQQDGQRLHHSRFSADMAGWQLNPDTIQLDWSDDAGFTFGTPVPQTTNNQSNGQYQWRRLGYARDRVYRLTWSSPGECALNGAYIDVIPHGT